MEGYNCKYYVILFQIIYYYFLTSFFFCFLQCLVTIFQSGQKKNLSGAPRLLKFIFTSQTVSTENSDILKQTCSLNKSS